MLRNRAALVAARFRFTPIGGGPNPATFLCVNRRQASRRLIIQAPSASGMIHSSVNVT